MKDHVVVVIRPDLTAKDCVQSVVGPFTEKEAEEYIPNPAPKDWIFLIIPLDDGQSEFSL